MPTLNSTWGDQFANSYVSLTQADSICVTSLIDPSAWTDATVPMRTAALLQSTRDVDASQYLGFRLYDVQALEFPRQDESAWPWNRTYMTHISTFSSAEEERMYTKVTQATALQAAYLLRQGGGTGRNRDIERQAAGITGWSESLGPMAQSVQYGSGSGTGGASFARSAEARMDPTAWALLADFRGMRRLDRA